MYLPIASYKAQLVYINASIISYSKCMYIYFCKKYLINHLYRQSLIILPPFRLCNTQSYTDVHAESVAIYFLSIRQTQTCNACHRRITHLLIG